MDTNQGKKKRSILKLAVYYAKSHMWCSFAMAILVSVILLLVIIMVYMKNQYYTYLVNTTYTTENALLNFVNKNIVTQLENYVNVGALLSTDGDLVEDIMEFLNGSRDANSRKRIRSSLQTAGRTSNDIVGLALADKNGVLYQYDKNEMVGMGTPIWGGRRK